MYKISSDTRDKKIWEGRELAKVLNTPLENNFIGGKLEFNTQDIKPGEIFIALNIGKRDGHEFIQDAFDRGAAAAIVSKKFNNELAEKHTLVKVDDTFEALINLAKYKRNQSHAKFIGVTGSVGKTSTKEFLTKILHSFGITYGNVGNFNNYLGVPLSLCALTGLEQFSVNELGMNKKGEISYLTNIIKPDIAIITNVADAHLGCFDSLEDIARAKCEIFEGLSPTGVAIINRDSEFFELQYKLATSRGIKNILTFGEHQEANYQLLKYEISLELATIKFRIVDRILSVNTYLRGKHQALNLTAIFATIHALGLDVHKAVKTVEELQAVEGRGKRYSYNVHDKHFTIIDDAYNANPTSVKAALIDLATINSDNKTVILADMKELGSREYLLHEELAEAVLSSGVKKLITIGPLMKSLSDKLENHIQCEHYLAATTEAFNNLIEEFTNNEIILIKGSNSTKLRDLIKYLNNYK